MASARTLATPAPGQPAARRPATNKAPRGPGRAPFLLARAAALDRGDAPWDKDDLLDALFLLRTLAGAGAGLAFGLGGITGGPPALLLLAALAAGGLAWARAVGVEDDEEYGGQNALLGEGLAPATALFLVSYSQG